jgi:VWFA-related protein
VVLSLVLTTGTVAQEGPPDDYLFSEVIEVQLVNVEVWVTDTQDRPVTGLTAADFEALEDGRPVEVTYFAEIEGDEPIVTSLERALAAPEPETRTPPAPEVDPSHLVVYFDQLHLLPASRRQAIEDLREFLALEEVPPERVLILAQDQSLKTEATFGSSWRELDEALTRLERSLPRGGMMASEKRLAIRGLHDLWKWALDVVSSRPTGDTIEAACEMFLPRAVPDVEAYAAESRERIGITLDHLASAASFLTGVPGVKTLLFVSDALERAPGTDLVELIKDLCPIQQKAPMFLLSDELSQEFRNLTRHANANRVTIYALQTEGLSSSFTGGAEQAGGVGFRASRSFDVAKRLSEREGMSILAAETGGRTVFNQNAFDAELAAIAREMSGYYSLAYEPPHRGDEREHEIQVRLKSRSLKARHRRGYRDKSPDTQMTERLQGAVYLGLVENSLGVRLGAGTVQAAAKNNRLTLPLHIFIPADSIVFLPAGDGVVAQVSVQVSTRNTVDQKGLFEHRAYRINWQTDSDQEVVALMMELEVPPGVHLIAVGVRDDATRETSFVSTTVEIHGAASDEATGP